jgi:apolipoprotein N-acyltransferase
VKSFYFFIIALLSGILLGAAWFPGFTFLIFIGFVPLLFLLHFFEQANSQKKITRFKKFTILFFGFLIWNLISTWWVYNASPAAMFAFILNSLFMTTTLLVADAIRKKIKKSTINYFVIVPVWLSFEYLYQQTDLSWSWLNIGNVLAFQSSWAQWYEFTGNSGGTAWIILVNIFVFLALKSKFYEGSWNKKINYLGAIVLTLPVLLSYFILFTAQERYSEFNTKEQSCIIIQPNIDPYNEKFVYGTQHQLEKFSNTIALLDSSAIKSADYVVLPETFLAQEIWEHQLDSCAEVLDLKNCCKLLNSKTKIVCGATTIKAYETEVSTSARKFSDGPGYYDFFNSALQIDASGKTQVYHKSKLVPGVETMPFSWLLKPLESLALQLGGTFGSLGRQDERSIFFDKQNAIKVAPVICYESIFSEYVTEYVKKGAHFIAIITNDGWWGNTPGYKQHFAYAKLRAIETRKPIVRSANTGISCFINPLGEVTHQTEYWKEAAIISKIQPNSYQTIFVEFGDWISLSSLIISLFLVAYAIFIRIKKA